MTRIQELIVFAMLCALPFLGRAQSSPTHPYEGAMYTYVVNGLNSGVEYSFYMSADVDGNSMLDDGSVFEFDFLDDFRGVVPDGENTATVQVLWNNGASQYMYYLWIEVSNPGGCSVRRGLHIVPQPNMFDLLSENIPSDNTQSCPQIDPNSGFNPLDTEYSVGNTNLQFRVRREGGNLGWMFEPVVSIDPDWNLDVEIVSVMASNSHSIPANDVNIYYVPASYNEVIVNVLVKNYAGTEQIVTLEIRNQKEEQTHLGDSNHQNDKVEHRISVMPVISDLEEIL